MYTVCKDRYVPRSDGSPFGCVHIHDDRYSSIDLPLLIHCRQNGISNSSNRVCLGGGMEKFGGDAGEVSLSGES